MNVKKILGFALGPLASAALGLLIIPMMSWYFSPEDMGRMRLFQVVLSFSLLLSVLGLDQAYVREFHGSKDVNSLLKACVLPGFAFLSFCIILSLPFQKQLTKWMFNLDGIGIYSLVVICILLNFFSRFQSLILRMQERGLAYSMSQVIPKFLQLLILGILIWLGVAPQFSVLLMILTISVMVVVLIYAWNTRNELRLAFSSQINKKELRTLIKFGFPLIFSGLAYWALTATSTIVLRSHSTMAELGVYSVTSSIAAAAAIFQSIFTVVWAPTVYKWVHQGVDMSKIDKIAQQALALICLIFAIVGAFAWITDYLLPAHYAKVKYLIVCAIVPPLLYTLSEITCLGVAITRKTSLTIWITLAALLSNIMLSFLLIPAYGATGAVISNAISYLVFFVGRTEFSVRVWRKINRVKIYFCLNIIIIIGIFHAFSNERLISQLNYIPQLCLFAVVFVVWGNLKSIFFELLYRIKR